MKRWMKLAFCILLVIGLTGCSLLDRAYGQISRTLWQIQQGLAAPGQVESFPAPTPEPRWVELEAYDLMEQGFGPLIAATEEWLRQGLEDAEDLNWNIHSLSLTLGTDGMPLTLTTDLYAYRDGQLRQGCRMEWDADAGRLHQEVNNVGTLMESSAESGADNTENPNLRPDLVAERLRLLPCSDLQQAMGTPLLVEFTAYSRPEGGQTVVDMENNPGGFDLALYQAGQYGKADGSPTWMITVRQAEDEDRSGTGTARFCFAPADASRWLGNPFLHPQTDIRVTEEGHLFYTRDWGENWNALPSRFEGLLAECIESCTAVTQSSWYVSPQPDGPVGFVLGGNQPVVVYSMDGGATWQEQTLGSYPHKADRRALCCAPDGSLYAAAGCEWSMGTGGKTGLFRCAPDAQSFEELPLPAELDGHYPICGVAAGEAGEVMISVETSAENNWPALYYTADLGGSWQALELPWEDVQADGVSFLYRVSWLRQQEDGTRQLCLTQEPTGVKGYDWCAVFTAPQPEGPWSFLSGGRDSASR